MIKANPSPNGNGFAFNLFGDPKEIRTPVAAVRGRSLNRLTMGPYQSVIYCSIRYRVFASDFLFISALRKNKSIADGKTARTGPARRADKNALSFNTLSPYA